MTNTTILFVQKKALYELQTHWVRFGNLAASRKPADCQSAI
jgi:hypothetical protein